jgi:Cu-processing system permease protein
MSAATASPTGSLRVLSRVAIYQASNVLRSRWLPAYVLFFALVTDALVRFGGDGGRALLSLVNVVLFVVPLVALVFGTTYLYDAREFTELLLAQPIGRPPLFGGLLLGLAGPLAAGFAAGVAAPFALHGVGDHASAVTLATLVACGMALTFVFVALAFVVATRSDDKVKGLGAAVGVWLVFGLLYDGAVLLAVAIFTDYPVERPLLAAMLANPIDLARVLLLLRFDNAALLGYTGAVFARFFGGAGALVAATVLLGWIAAPIALGLRAFRRKDF